ncbi:MAG TPA: TonB-dependent receptor [Sphingomonas sp.]
MNQIFWGAALGAMATALSAGAAQAQTASDPAPAAPPAPADTSADAPKDIVVTGVRASLQSAQNVKRNASSIVDSIVAEDIGKLPDNNATEALQRITGVQVSRDVGEGGSIAIRGLPQVETTLNGRETFTAGGGRTFNFQDLPAELIGRIDVYKSPTADLIEGGLGGTVDVRTHLPFDFAGATLSATLRNNYADRIKKSEPMASLLVSDRWQTGIGEIGFLAAVSYQERSYRQDLDSTGAPTPRVPGLASQIDPTRTVFAPNGNYQVLITGNRQRIGANAALQWRPASNLEFSLEGQYQRFRTNQQQYSVNIPTAGSPYIAGSASYFGGTNDVSQASYSNQIITAGGTERDLLDVNKQVSLKGKWSSGNFTLTGDGTYTKSKSDLWYTELDLVTRAPVFTQYAATNPPSSSAPGFDLSNISNYTVGGLTRNENHYVGHEWAGRLDGEYKFDGGFLSAIDVGFRFSDRAVAQQHPVRYVGQTKATNPNLYPGLFTANQFGDFYTGAGSGLDFQRNYPYAIPTNLTNGFNGVVTTLGLAAPDPNSVGNQLAGFAADEKSYAGYVMAKFNFNDVVDGNIGVRWVRTEDSINGFQLRRHAVTDPITKVTTYVLDSPPVVDPVIVDNAYDKWLPSANIRFHLTHNLQLRLAGSKTLTRPDFSQLSPAVTVVQGQLAASSGNPNLSPITSTNADVSLEWYFGKSSSLYIAGFYKRVKGFIFTRATPGQTIDGVTGYTVSLPVNSDPGTVKGVEVGYQQFFDFLPGALSGLGLQANYTYADSKAPSSLVGFTAPLTQLSKNSFNVAAIYEKYGVSARVAYNYRSSFLSSILAGGYTPPGGSTVSYVFPVYTKGYGWLDASLNVDVGKHFTLTFDAQNIQRTQIQQYYQVSTQPGQFTIDDRQFMVGVRVKY